MMKSRLLRFDGTVESDPAIITWLNRQKAHSRSLARRWFAVMRNCGDEVREVFHDGCPVACLGDAPFAYVNVFAFHVNLGFFHGSSLPDPARLLLGTGKFMRHVKLKAGEPANDAALRALIDAAYSDIKSRVESGS